MCDGWLALQDVSLQWLWQSVFKLGSEEEQERGLWQLWWRLRAHCEGGCDGARLRYEPEKTSLAF